MDDDKYQDHLLKATETASRDTDSLVAKIATAGITAVLAIAALAESAPAVLIAAGFLFGGSLVVALTGLRLSADALLWHVENYPERPECRYTLMKFLNYFALLLLVAGVVCAAFAVNAVTIPTSGN